MFPIFPASDLLGDRLCGHPWPPALAEDLEELWFADQLADIQAAIASFGDARGVTIRLEFVDGGIRLLDQSFALSVLTAGNLLVPYNVLGLRDQTSLPTASELVELYKFEAARLLAAGATLESRYREMRTEALSCLEELPPSCGLSAIIRYPVELGREDPTNSKSQIEIGINILDSHLDAAVAIIQAQTPEEIGPQIADLRYFRKSCSNSNSD